MNGNHVFHRLALRRASYYRLRNAIQYFVEVKSWNKHIALTRIKDSLSFSKKTDGTDGAPGQLMKDLAAYLGSGGNNNIRWEFSDELSCAKN
ncbi:hypothetical protein [Stutzerimonas stutzeri]|uniref:hypothetical protein n=1 Tax=Stutzerimonas stutzeri TaxID=316 RepID=UPI00210DD433|nr:hypothetical protein [Stutzerimonas stutzeri]MCQ4261090.1 hypothetical protein [Stutzerimonas stutzeri]